MTYIKDPLYGYIQLSDEEKNILDTPQMQRLRNIRQLGLSSQVYPGATHTRFEHSLGVMHLAGEFADSLELDERRRKELRLAALMHDTGHGPFSHASENLARLEGKSHEDYSCQVMEELEDSYSVNSDRLKRMIKGELELGRIVAGDIDADRMDYLMRDAHASGLEHGHLDYRTIIRCAEVDSRRLVYGEKAVDALESLFTSRFHMLKTLYYHHAAVIAEKMIERALKGMLTQGYEVDEIMRMDDRDAHSALKNSEGRSKKIYSRIENRNLFKRALVWGPDELSREEIKSINERINAREAEKRIAEKAGVEEWKVIVDPPKIPEIQSIDVNIKKNDGSIVPLSTVSPIPEALTEAEWRTVDLRVYAPENVREEVSEAAETVISNYSNVLDRYMS